MNIQMKLKAKFNKKQINFRSLQIKYKSNKSIFYNLSNQRNIKLNKQYFKQKWKKINQLLTALN